MPYKAAIRDGHEHMVMDPIIIQTAGRDIVLTFFANQNARNMHLEDQARYLELQRDYPHFTLMKGVPFHRLPETIGDCHFGLLYDQKSISSWSDKAYAYNMSTKIFSYFEAGLPLVVYNDLTYICEITEQHGLGIVYSLDRVQELPDLIAAADYPALRDNVRRYRDQNEIETLLPTLEKAYNAVPF